MSKIFQDATMLFLKQFQFATKPSMKLILIIIPNFSCALKHSKMFQTFKIAAYVIANKLDYMTLLEVFAQLLKNI